MKRILLAVAAVALTALTTSSVSAQYPPAPGGNPPPGFAGMPPGYAAIPQGYAEAMGPMGPMGYPDPQAAAQAAEAKSKLAQYRSQYGVSPIFRVIFCGKGCTSCNGEPKHPGIFHALCKKSQGAVPPPFPVGNGGTLVFPNHPFVRSPRDFFMVD